MSWGCSRFVPTAASILAELWAAAPSPAAVPLDLGTYRVVSTPPGSEHLASADFDRDGHLDLVVGGEQSNYVSILRGDGSGRFSEAGLVRTGRVSALLAFDATENGYVDLVVGNPVSGEIALVRGNGSGGFSDPEITSLPA